MLDPDAFLLKDYELKISYLTDHFARLWNRFSYFVSVETALFTGKILFPSGALSWALPLLGFFLSLAWYLVAAQDRYLIRIYRRQIDKVAERIGERLYEEQSDFGGLTAVGETTNTGVSLDAADKEQPAGLRKLLDQLTGWRYEVISTTHMAVWIPFFA